MTSQNDHPPLPKRWQVHHEIPKEVDRALSNFTPLMRQLLYNRGFQDAHTAASFVNGTVNFPTDPFLMKDMPKAICRIRLAVEKGEAVAIYGDYDADGVTATALLMEFFSSLGVEVRAYIPNREDEGYGLNVGAIQQLAGEGMQLIITADCGVRAVSQVSLANQLGMEVIVTDHHQPEIELPPAVAIINPKQEGDPYPEKYLAGVGLAYKLAQAYLAEYPVEGVQADAWLDLVAIGTVADLAPLKGENRLLVRAGLEKLRYGLRQGIFSLAQVANIDLTKCDAANIGFGLGPRLNAAGRLESAMVALELLTSRDMMKVGELAQALEMFNTERQGLTQQIREKVGEQILREDPDAILFFAASPEFPKGVVGLAASRLTEAYYRPSVIAHQGEDVTVASCRSIPEFHITRALDACSELLVKHGGHAAAAGFTVRNQDLEMLVAKLKSIAEKELGNMELLPVLKIDRDIKLDKLESKHIPGILDDLRQLEPTGRGNPEPIFVSRNVDVRHARVVGRDGSHLKLTVSAGANTFDAIAFRQGYWLDQLPETIDIAYRFEMNEFNGRSTLQLNVREIKAAESGTLQ